MAGLTKKREDFAQALVKNGGNKLEAYKEAGYSQKMTKGSMWIEANKLSNIPNISLRVQDLQEKASVVANEKFSISVEERLKRLNYLYSCGIEESSTPQGTKIYQNLSVAKQCIEVMNAMLGVTFTGDVKPVKVHIGVVDAS
jgi:phage terminase small subunit